MPDMPTLVQREADLSLRAAQDFVRPRVIWPPDPEDASPIAIFLWDRESGFEEVADALSREGGFIVLALHTIAPDLAAIAVEWVADHGELLGGDPDRLVVAGGGLAATVALQARDEGWPPITRQLLIGPDVVGWPPAEEPLAGAAPATVVNARGYAARLREAGVEVQELLPGEPMTFDLL